MKWQKPTRREVCVVLLFVGAFCFAAFGRYNRSQYYSCHLCGNRMQIDTMRLVFIPVDRTERFLTEFAVEPDHQHDWFSYSGNYALGYIGTKGVWCNRRMYRDESYSKWKNREQ